MNVISYYIIYFFFFYVFRKLIDKIEFYICIGYFSDTSYAFFHSALGNMPVNQSKINDIV